MNAHLDAQATSGRVVEHPRGSELPQQPAQLVDLPDAWLVATARMFQHVAEAIATPAPVLGETPAKGSGRV